MQLFVALSVARVGPIDRRMQSLQLPSVCRTDVRKVADGMPYKEL